MSELRNKLKKEKHKTYIMRRAKQVIFSSLSTEKKPFHIGSDTRVGCLE